MDAHEFVPVGLDLAKASFVAMLRLPSGKYRQRKFDNALGGFRDLHAWLQQHLPPELQQHGAKAIHACMEATGTYGEALAAFLYDRGGRVSVVNPRQIAHYAKSRLSRAKTDKVDARLICDFCQKEQPRLWSPPAPAYRELQALLRHQEALTQDLQRERNRLGAAEHPSTVRQSLEALITFLEEALANVEADLRAHFEAHPELKRQRKWLVSIPGIGEATARWLLGELGGAHGFRNARQVAAYAGLEPRLQESGPWKGQTRISKQGNAWLRKALYFPALSALTWNPLIKALADRLRQRGLVPMAIVAAAMRKLLHLAFGVLRHRSEFDPQWAT
ncbi:MAG: IS110 family transposase [Armatimonadota bacterium]